MMKSRAVYLLSPEESPETVYSELAKFRQTDFEPCAVVDPVRAQETTLFGTLPVFSGLMAALRATRATSVVYDGHFIDVNGAGKIKSRQEEELA